MPDNQVTIVHTEASIVASTTAVVVATPARKYLHIQNDDDALIVWIAVGQAAVLSEGIRLGPHEVYEMTPAKNNVDPRAVNGIASAAGPAIVTVAQA